MDTASSLTDAAGAACPVSSSASTSRALADSLRAQDICRLLVESAAEGMYAVDAEGITTFVNPAVSEMTGWAAEELLGRPQQQFVAKFPSPAGDTRSGEDALFLCKDGTCFPAAYTRTPMFREGRLSATVVVFQDISEKRRSEQWKHTRSALRAESDQLPALPGRPFMENCLREAIVTAQRRGKRIGVCCLHLDRLKQMTGSLGNDFGNALIKAVSDRLNQSMRAVDIPAQYGEDEFLLALCELNEPSEAEQTCQRLLKELKTPFLVKGQPLTMTANVGISLFPEHGETPELLLQHAHIALRALKQTDRSGLQMYSAAMGMQSRRAAEMPEALLRAITETQFHMAYQPIYTVSGAIAGFEALLRWNHPDWGNISPLDFIATAERTGLIVPIGDWVIEEVCRQAVAWHADNLPPVKIFANVSGVQLERPDFSSKIANTLLQSGLPANRLELEITESWIIADLKGAADKLLLLRDLGIGIAIDDFGTGYSTFNYLQELPIDTIKIDRSFTQRLNGSKLRHSTVRAITVMAHQMGLKIVAEGVETAQQADELAEIGCDLMQGFLLGRPLLPHDALVLLEKQQAIGPFSIAGLESPAAELTQTRSCTLLERTSQSCAASTAL